MHENLLVVMSIVALVILMSSLVYTEQSEAQLGPVPLPAPQLPLSSSPDKGIADADGTPTPPSIQIVNHQLNEGKNVVRIEVSPDSKISNCMIYYAIHSTNKTAQCLRESGTIYKGLVEAEYPSQTVKITISDYSNTNATIQSNLSVKKAITVADIPHVIRDWICKNIWEC
jgi:hypothetical protein